MVCIVFLPELVCVLDSTDVAVHNFWLVNCLSSEEGKEEILKVTFEELRQAVALYAAAMRRMGVKVGDRVVGE